MLKKKLILLLIVFNLLNIYPNNDTTSSIQIANLNTEVTNLKEEIELLKSSLKGFRENEVNNFSNLDRQINLMSLTITIFTYLFPFLALIIGIYITVISNKITNSRKHINDIKDEIIELKTIIENDLETIFEKFLKYDKDTTLDRLIKVPEDINNLTYKLLTSDLDEDDYLKLKESFLTCPDMGEDGTAVDHDRLFSFGQQFFQHFMGHLITDNEIKNKFNRYLNDYIELAFKCDINKCIDDMLSLVIKRNINKYKSEITSFFTLLNKSNKHNSEKEYYVTCYTALKTKRNREKFLKIMEENNNLEKSKEYFISVIHDYEKL